MADNPNPTFTWLRKVYPSKAMHNVLTQAENLSGYNIPILILGESGVGKHYLAQAIYQQRKKLRQSELATYPYIEVNCASIEPDLFASELFGHVQGAFTGAYCDTLGLVDQAKNGLLFIDEIAGIPLPVQAKILHLLESRRKRKVGALTWDEPVEIELILASNYPWKELQNSHMFRQDLLYRMAAVIEIPTLVSRPQDFEFLLKYFLRRYRKKVKAENPGSSWSAPEKIIVENEFAEDVLEALRRYTWPGNVREVQHAIEIACIQASGQIIKYEHLANFFKVRRIWSHNPVPYQRQYQEKEMPTEADLRFTRKLVTRGLASDEQVKICLQLYHKLAERGKVIPLPELFVRKKYLERTEMEKIVLQCAGEDFVGNDANPAPKSAPMPAGRQVYKTSKSLPTPRGRQTNKRSNPPQEQRLTRRGKRTWSNGATAPVELTETVTAKQEELVDVSPSFMQEFLPLPDDSVDDSGEKTIAKPHTIEIGSLFRNYHIIDELGHGGMGVVYKAMDTNSGQVVALKLIQSLFLGNKQVRRFLQEAMATAQLDHPNIVKVYEVSDNPNYFSMEYIEGSTLSSLIKERRLTPWDTAMLLEKVALALHSAHGKGIIHRDIKPSNIMIAVNGEPKIMDFGLAKIIDTEQGLSRTGDILGTPAYMPPEQAASKEVGPRSDVYSLGATLYEVLTGRPPFQGYSGVNILYQIAENDPIAPCALNPDIPEPLATICLKCMEKNPENRYASTAALATDLRNFLEQRPINARLPGLLSHWRKFMLRHKMAVMGSAIVVIGILWIGGNYLWGLHRYNDCLSREKSAIEQQKIRSNKALLRLVYHLYHRHKQLQNDPEYILLLRKTLSELEKEKLLSNLVPTQNETDQQILWLYNLLAAQAHSPRK